MKLKGHVTTYSRWLLGCMSGKNFNDNFERKSANFTASGVETVVADKSDRQLYKITIEPLYETDELDNDLTFDNTR